MCTVTDKSGQQQTVTMSVEFRLSSGGRGSNHSQTLGRITGYMLQIVTCLRRMFFFGGGGIKTCNETKQIRRDVHTGLYIHCLYCEV
jgi:hypothetical protein